MALLQDILSQLEGFGFWGMDFLDIADLDPSGISQKLRTKFGLGGADLPSHLFQPISQDILASGLAKTYSPQVEAHGQSLLGDLQSTLGGEQGKKAMGGFAGSGQQRRFTTAAKDVYGKGMSDVLSQTGEQRIRGLQSVQDIISSWRDTALRIKHG